MYITYIHTYHSRFIPEGISEVSQILFRDTHIYNMQNIKQELFGIIIISVSIAHDQCRGRSLVLIINL
jgi:hypothetical protein